MTNSVQIPFIHPSAFFLFYNFFVCSQLKLPEIQFEYSSNTVVEFPQLWKLSSDDRVWFPRGFWVSVWSFSVPVRLFFLGQVPLTQHRELYFFRVYQLEETLREEQIFKVICGFWILFLQKGKKGKIYLSKQPCLLLRSEQDCFQTNTSMPSRGKEGGAGCFCITRSLCDAN